MNNYNPEDLTILIVDDTPQNIQLLGQILAERGYQVLVATGGEQAITTMERRCPDLILLDIMMPDMDGFETCARIKDRSEWEDIPVIFLSAKTMTQDKVKGFAIGASDYVTKPFETAEVLARVQTQLRLKMALATIKTYNQELESLVEARTKELVRSERQATVSLMVEGIVHNMRNPLNMVWGGLEMIELERDMGLKKFGPNPDVSQLAGLIDRIAGHAKMADSGAKMLNDMINSLMAKSRSDQNASIERIDLNRLVAKEVEFLEADIDLKHKVRQDVQLAASPLYAEAVGMEVAQVFQNLIQNAKDAMNGQVDPAIWITSGAADGRVWFAVRDNGPGIDEGHLARIFDPFFTTKAAQDAGPDEGPKGTGLGLHMCKEIVQSYGGGIEVESKVGEGVAFTVFLPCCK